MSHPPSVVLSLSPGQHWTLHHALLDRIDQESTTVTATAAPPTVEEFQIFDTLDSGNAQFTLAHTPAPPDEGDTE